MLAEAERAVVHTALRDGRERERRPLRELRSHQPFDQGGRHVFTRHLITVTFRGRLRHLLLAPTDALAMRAYTSADAPAGYNQGGFCKEDDRARDASAHEEIAQRR